MIPIELDVNGAPARAEVEPTETLLAFLRDRLGLTGAKEVCAEGECGACTVLVDGEPVTSCLMLAAQADGRKVVTIEGLASEEGLHPLQEAFLDAGAVQCGYCTPGMILSLAALIERSRAPESEEIREAIEGNLCRCTGYLRIVEAARRVTR